MDVAATIYLLIADVQATPAIEFPFDSQLPLVARVATPFQFVFAENTFRSDEPNALNYSIASSPLWLHLDSNDRTLSGTPGISDVGTVAFDLIGSDTTGSATMPATIVVSADAGTSLNGAALPLLVEDGQLSDIAIFAVSHSKPFSFGVDPDIFSSGKNTSFYARSANNSPLASWINFNSTTLTFSGTAPPLDPASPMPQVFNLSVIASDINGFRSATATLSISVSSHILAFERAYLKLNFNAGDHFSTPHLRDSLLLDNERLRDGDLVNIAADFPDWLTLDEDTLSLSGTAPQNADSDTAVISASDNYGDTASITISLQGPRLFSGDIGSCNIVAGKEFTHTFENSLLNEESTTLHVDQQASFPWIKYNSDTRTLYGRAPSDMETQIITIPLRASNGTVEESTPFTIRVYSADGPCTSNSANLCPTSASPPTNFTEVTKSKKFIIPMAVIVPILVLALGVWIYGLSRGYWSSFCYPGRSRKKRGRPTPLEIKEKYLRDSDRISFEESSRGSKDSISSSKAGSNGLVSPASELQSASPGRYSTNSKDKSQAPVRTSHVFSRPVSGFGGTSPKGNEGHSHLTTKSHAPTPKNLAFLQRRGSFNPYWPRGRSSAALAGPRPFYNPKAACPHGKKLSDVGHGATSSSPPTYGTPNRLWTTTESSSSTDGSLGELTSCFPLPPGSQGSERSPNVTELPHRHSADLTLASPPRGFSDSERWKASTRSQEIRVHNASLPLTSWPTPPAPSTNRSSSRWTTTYDELPAPLGRQRFSHYSFLSPRSPNVGSAFDNGPGLHNHSQGQSLQHSRTRSLQSGESGSDNRHGWMARTTIKQAGKSVVASDREGSSGHQSWYAVSPPLPPLPESPQHQHSYPSNMSGGSHEIPSPHHGGGHGSKSSIKGNATTSPLIQNPKTRQLHPPSSVVNRDGEKAPQLGAREQQRWKLGETQESRYADIRSGIPGMRNGLRIIISDEGDTFF